MSDADYVAIFERNIGNILAAIGKAVKDPSAYNSRNDAEFYVRSNDYRPGLL